MELHTHQLEISLSNMGDVTIIDALNPMSEKSETLGAERLEICSNCDDLINTVSVCKHCGCFMKIKTKLIKASCPIGKW